MQKRVLVVGGAGFIGSHMVRRLMAAKIDCVILDNLCNGYKASLPEGITFYEGELGDKEWVAKLLKAEGITHVMHFAAHAMVGESVVNPLKYYSNNVAATVHLLEAMQEVGVKNFIFSSTCATYGNPQYMPMDEKHPQNPINPYGASKLVVENLLRDLAAQKQIAYAALRYFNAAGCSSDGSIGSDHQPESHLIPLVLKVALGQRDSISILGTDYPTPDGTAQRDYIHVEDLTEAHLLVLNKLNNPGDAYELNLGTGVPCSVTEVIEACRKVTGHPIPAKLAPRRAGDPSALYADNRKAMEVLGWKPKFMTIESVVQSTWNWYKKHPQGYPKNEEVIA